MTVRFLKNGMEDYMTCYCSNGGPCLSCTDRIASGIEERYEKQVTELKEEVVRLQSVLEGARAVIVESHECLNQNPLPAIFVLEARDKLYVGAEKVDAALKEDDS